MSTKESLQLGKITTTHETISFLDMRGRYCCLDHNGPSFTNGVTIRSSSMSIQLDNDQTFALLNHLTSWLKTGSFNINNKDDYNKHQRDAG